MSYLTPGSIIQWTPNRNPAPIPAMIIKSLPSDDCVCVILLDSGEVTVSRVDNIWLPEEVPCVSSRKLAGLWLERCVSSDRQGGCELGCDGSLCDGL